MSMFLHSEIMYDKNNHISNIAISLFTVTDGKFIISLLLKISYLEERHNLKLVLKNFSVFKLYTK